MSGVLTVLSAGSGESLISVSPETATVTGSTSTLVTNSVTASSPGAVSPTWAWTFVSGGAFTATNPTGSSTAFVAEGLMQGGDRSALWRVTLSSAGVVVGSRDVPVFAART